jgi:hypothetical protein
VLPALRSLNLNGAQKRNSGIWAVSLTDLDLDALAGMKRLESLDLGGVSVTDAGLPRLNPLSSLRMLDLSRTQVSAAGLASLRLTGLERLSLWKAKRVNDAAAEHLLKFEKLSVLDLSETGLGDAALAQLSGLKNLRKLFVRGSGVTAGGVEAFRAANPQCEVSWQ